MIGSILPQFIKLYRDTSLDDLNKRDSSTVLWVVETWRKQVESRPFIRMRVNVSCENGLHATHLQTIGTLCTGVEICVNHRINLSPFFTHNMTDKSIEREATIVNNQLELAVARYWQAATDGALVEER